MLFAILILKRGRPTDIMIDFRSEFIGLKSNKAVMNVKNCHCSLSGGMTNADSAAELAPI